MLPQMMPLPWLVIFFFIFICYFSMMRLVSLFYFFFSLDLFLVKGGEITFPW
uniref:ATP synthase F0 subunit 8 n=1 Tax=Thyreophagus entomophagus TaxID=2874286 RepID=A0A977PM48_9ACAR|nr:ATP synthase F0 subunit 8 [Thyreophagus entomophagus]UXD78882.1 ATP synthase F0 subunit 8 [Thyreophagus entomophagus]